MHRWAPKDPDEVLDYIHNWAPRVGADDAITGIPTCTVESGTITVDSTTLVGLQQLVWLSGGVAGETVTLTLQIETIGGRTYEEGVQLLIRER